MRTRLIIMAWLAGLVPVGLLQAGSLFVASQSSHQVFQFDGETGEALASSARSPTRGAWTWVPTATCTSPVHPTTRYWSLMGRPGKRLGAFCSIANPGSLAFGPNGNMFVASESDHRVKVFDGDSGELLDLVLLVGDPGGMAFTLPNNLYVASEASHVVLGFDGESGKSLGTFCTIANPRGLAFEPGGNLFAASASSHQVLQFDGASGEAMGPFCTVVQPGIPGNRSQRKPVCRQ